MKMKHKISLLVATALVFSNLFTACVIRNYMLDRTQYKSPFDLFLAKTSDAHAFQQSPVPTSLRFYMLSSQMELYSVLAALSEVERQIRSGSAVFDVLDAVKGEAVATAEGKKAFFLSWLEELPEEHFVYLVEFDADDEFRHVGELILDRNGNVLQDNVTKKRR